MIIVTQDRRLLLLLKKPRSKWYHLCCIGNKRHYRKNGGCKHIDEFMPSVREDVRSRIKIDGWGGKEQASAIPEPTPERGA